MVASRLSDQPEWKVLLLEAGPDEPPGAEVPSMVAMFLGTSAIAFPRPATLPSRGHRFDALRRTVTAEQVPLLPLTLVTHGYHCFSPRHNRFPVLRAGSEIDWQYQTVNEENACLGTGGSCDWPRGKNLGGTSVHNGMMYTRGHAKDFNDWAAMGNEGWSWEEVKRELYRQKKKK